MKRAIIPIFVVAVLTFLSCFLIANEYNKNSKRIHREEIAKSEQAEDNSGSDETNEMATAEDLTTQLIGILVIMNEDTNTMTFQDIISNNRYLFEYDSSTKCMNKYEDIMSLQQLKVGEIYEINYSIHTRKINYIKVSQDVWSVTDVVKFSVDEKKKMFTIAGDDPYQITSDTVLVSDDEEIEWMDITELDTLIVKGYNRKVCSIIVQKGHGYVRLKNDAYFIGGWIEVGQSVIKPISPDMLLPVPEGSYKVRLTNRGYAGEVDVDIVRDKESLIDLEEIEIEEVAVGHIAFNITPEYALLYIDDEMSEYEDRISLEYGVHKIRVEAAGYTTVSTNISVNSEYADISISLDEEREQDDSSSSSSSNIPVIAGNSSSSYNGTIAVTNDPTSSTTAIENSQSTSSSSSTTSDTIISPIKKIFVEHPEGAEVYLDGAYIGIAPASTTKVTGSHVITLSRSGYETKSYTITIDNDDNDVTLSFSELMAQ